jgi:hypothetical protein
MAYGVILKHLEVDKIKIKKKIFKGVLTAFSAGKRGGCRFFSWCGEHWVCEGGPPDLVGKFGAPPNLPYIVLFC